MKVLSRYQFQNGKSLEVHYLNRGDLKKRGVPECDSLALVTVTPEGRNSLYLRPDEAVTIIALLSRAVFKCVKAYDVGLLRGYDGFDV